MTRQPFPKISLYLGHVDTCGVQAVNNLTMMLKLIIMMMMLRIVEVTLVPIEGPVHNNSKNKQLMITMTTTTAR